MTEQLDKQWQKDDKFNPKGGYGQISLFTNKVTKECLAVKQLLLKEKQDAASEEKQRVSWNKECQMMLQLKHDNIVRTFPAPQEVIDICESDLPLLAMEYCADGDLRKILYKPENMYGLPVGDVMSVMHDISSAIEYIHSIQLIHRDIKPDNILVARCADQPSKLIYKLSDLGFAKNLSTECLTQTKLGTVLYMAPEVLSDTKGYSYTADYWSFGTVVFECITKRLPFFHTNNVSQEQRINWLYSVFYSNVKCKNVVDIYGYFHPITGQRVFARDLPEPHRFTSHRTLVRYIEQWLRLMLHLDPLKRGGPRDEQSGRHKCFKHLDDILSLQFVNVFNVWKSELLCCAVHSDTSSSPPTTTTTTTTATTTTATTTSVSLQEVLQLHLMSTQHTSVNDIEVLSADGQLVDVLQPAVNFSQSCLGAINQLVYVVDRRLSSLQPSSLPQQLRDLTASPNVPRERYLQFIKLLVYHINQRLTNIQLLKAAVQAESLSSMNKRLKLSAATQTLNGRFKYFFSVWHFYNASVKIDQNEMPAQFRMTSDVWNLPAECIAHYQLIKQAMNDIELQCQMIDKSLSRVEYFSAESTQRSLQLCVEEQCSRTIYEQLQQILQQHKEPGTIMIADPGYLMAVRTCLQRFVSAEEQFIGHSSDCLRSVLASKHEIADCLTYIEKLHPQLDAAVAFLTKYQQQRQKQQWQLLTHTALQLAASKETSEQQNVSNTTTTTTTTTTTSDCVYSRNAAASECDVTRAVECTSKNVLNVATDCSQLVTQAKNSKSQLANILDSLLSDDGRSSVALLDWSFLDINSSGFQ